MKKQTKMQNGRLIGVGFDLPEVIVKLDQAATIPLKETKMQGESVGDNIAPVQYKENESREDHMDRQKEMETVSNNNMDTGWRENGNIGSQYTENRQENLDTLAKFQESWDGPLGRIDMDKLCMELNGLHVRPINYAVYRTGLHARE